MTKPKRSILFLAALAMAAAGCDQGTGPEDRATFDAQAVLGDYRALDSLLASDVMAGFRAMAGGITFQSVGGEGGLDLSLPGGIASAPWALEGLSRGDARASSLLATALARATEQGVDGARAPIISSLRRGKTFVYDPALGRYVLDPDREGAPATGVRFILYAPAAGRPDVNQEIGHADLIDQGDGSAEDVALRLVVVEGDRTVLDYATTLDIQAQGGTITVEGFLQGPYDRLLFDLSVQGSSGPGGSEVDISFAMELEERGFVTAGSVQGMDGTSGEGGEIHIEASHGTDSFALDATGTDTRIDGTVRINGELFATITGDPDEPTITSADGDALTGLEVLVLLHIIDVAEDVFDLFEDLLDPIDELVILALIL